MRIVNKRHLKAYYGVTGIVAEYSDGSARLRIYQMGRLQHNKVHKNAKAALAAWYRANA